MEDKHAKILKKLFWTFDDNIKDSKYFVDYVHDCKMLGDMDMANFFLNRAKTRIDDNESVKSKIESIIAKYPDTAENPLKVLYDLKMDEYADTRAKISKMTI